MNMEIPKNAPQPEKPRLNTNLLAGVMGPVLLSANDAAELQASGISITSGGVSSIFISANLYKQYFPSAISSLRPTFKEGVFGVVFFEQTPKELKTWFLDFPPIATAAGAARAKIPQLEVKTKTGIKLIARALVSGQVQAFPYGRLKQVFDWNSFPALDRGIFVDWPLLVADKDAEILDLKNKLQRSEQLRAAPPANSATNVVAQAQNLTTISKAEPTQPVHQASFLESSAFGACVILFVLMVLGALWVWVVNA